MPKVAIMQNRTQCICYGTQPKTCRGCLYRSNLRLLNKDELEVVLAHELSHVKNRDILTMTMASFVAMIASMIMQSFFFTALLVIRMKVAAGDHLFVDRLSYNFRAPERGEIVVFETRGIQDLPPDQFYIKRLCGLGSETLCLHQDYVVSGCPPYSNSVPVGNLLVNDQPITAATRHFENVYSFYGASGHHASKAKGPDQTLPFVENHYFGHAMIRRLAPGAKFTVDHEGAEIAGDQIDPLAVGRQSQGVRTVVAVAVQFLEQRHLVELIVAIGIAQPVETALAVARDVEAVEGEQQTHGRAEVDVQPLDARRLAAADRRRRDAKQAAASLVAGDDPALGIDGHRDPGAERLFRHGEQSLDLKTGQQMKCVARNFCSRLTFGRLPGHRGRHADRDLGLLRHQVFIAPGGAGARQRQGGEQATPQAERQISSVWL